MSAYSCRNETKKDTKEEWGQILCLLSHDHNHWFQTIETLPPKHRPPFYLLSNAVGTLDEVSFSEKWCIIRSARENSPWLKENISLVSAHFKHSLHCLFMRKRHNHFMSSHIPRMRAAKPQLHTRQYEESIYKWLRVYSSARLYGAGLWAKC